MKYLFYVLSCLFIVSCNIKSNNENRNIGYNYHVSNFLELCQSDLKLDTSIIDTTNNYKISFPSGWDTENVNETNFSGIFAFDTITYIEQDLIQTFQINFQDRDKKLTLAEIFKSEVDGLSDDGFLVKEIGNISINENPSKWVLSVRETSEGVFNDLLVYTKNPSDKKLIILHISVLDTEGFKERICRLKNILLSLSIYPQISEV